MPRRKFSSPREGLQIVGIIIMTIKTGVNSHWKYCFTCYAKYFARINSFSLKNCPLLLVLLLPFFRCRLKPEGSRRSRVICQSGWDYCGSIARCILKLANSGPWLQTEEQRVGSLKYFLMKKNHLKGTRIHTKISNVMKILGANKLLSLSIC